MARLYSYNALATFVAAGFTGFAVFTDHEVGGKKVMMNQNPVNGGGNNGGGNNGGNQLLFANRGMFFGAEDPDLFTEESDEGKEFLQILQRSDAKRLAKRLKEDHGIEDEEVEEIEVDLDHFFKMQLQSVWYRNEAVQYYLSPPLCCTPEEVCAPVEYYFDGKQCENKGRWEKLCRLREEHIREEERRRQESAQRDQEAREQPFERMPELRETYGVNNGVHTGKVNNTGKLNTGKLMYHLI
jgi:hypothetical protein